MNGGIVLLSGKFVKLLYHAKRISNTINENHRKYVENHKKEFEDNIKGLSKEEAIKACTMQSAFLNMAER